MGTAKWLNITKEELLEILHMRTKELGRTPKSKEMKDPGAAVYYDRFETNSWNCILSLAGLKLNHVQSYTDEFLLERLKEFCNYLGRNPKKEDFKKHNWIPSERGYHTHFGGLQKSLQMIGKLDVILDAEERLKVSIKELIEMAHKLNKTPNVNEYDKYKKYGFPRRSFEDITGLSYNELCKKYIPEYKLNLDVTPITKQDCKEDMEALFLKLGRIPSIKEVNGKNNKYTMKRYFTTFKTQSYYNILVELGYQPNFKKLETKTDEELFEDFYLLFNKIGRIPYSYEMDKSESCSNYSVYMKRFGNIQEVCKQLDIDYVANYRKSGAGIVCKDKNGDICKSIPEMDITNFFIDNNLLVSKENYYNELIETSKKYRFDWKIIYDNKMYYVEFLGMYNKSRCRGSRDRKYTEIAKKKIKMLYKNGKLNQCILLYKDDYDNQKIQEKLEKILNNKFNNIVYSSREQFSRYNQLSNEEILKEVMNYSNNKSILPSTSVLIENNSGLYTEILYRFDTYENFAVHYNMICLQRKNNTEKRKQLFEYLSVNYNVIGSITNISKIVQNDMMLRGLNSLMKDMGILDFKLEYFSYCIENKFPISYEDLEWLEQVENNGYLLNKDNEKMQRIAFILDNTINKGGYIEFKNIKHNNKENKIKEDIINLFLHMKKEYSKILPTEEYQKLVTIDDKLKVISMPNYIRKNNMTMLDAKLMFYNEMLKNITYTFDNNDIIYLHDVVSQNKMKVGRFVDESHAKVAKEILGKCKKIS